MSQPEELGDDVYVAESYRTGRVPGDVGVPIESRRLGDGGAMGRDSFQQTGGRVMGSPLPMGNPLPAGGGGGMGPEGHKATNPPGRALTVPMGSGDDPSAMARAMNMLKQAAPFVAKLLPLLDGSFGTALSNLFAPRQQPPQATSVTVDLAPVQSQISDLQLQHNELRSTVQEQTTGIKRMEDQLELVREATDRNTLEQQELIVDLRAMGRKVNLFALLLSVLL